MSMLCNSLESLIAILKFLTIAYLLVVDRSVHHLTIRETDIQNACHVAIPTSPQKKTPYSYWGNEEDITT